MLCVASDSCVCAHLRYRQESALRLQERKEVGPPHLTAHLYDIPDLSSSFFNSLSLCILIIRISDNSKSFFYLNDFEISRLDYIFDNYNMKMGEKYEEETASNSYNL